MRALSDTLLGGGCAAHVESVHGEQIEVLTGASAGQKFTGVVEIESDITLGGESGDDPRAKVMLRFSAAKPQPVIKGQCRVKTADGRVWFAVRSPQNGYLTTDFELMEMVSGTDT